MSRLDVVVSEYEIRHADLLRCWSRLCHAVKVSGPPSNDPAEVERQSQRDARMAAAAYAERWQLFNAAKQALNRELQHTYPQRKAI